MIIEFIGSTGAGKTTLISMVQPRLAKKAQVITSFDLVAGMLGLGRVTNPTVRNLIQDLTGFPFFLGSLARHRRFVAFALKTLARQKRSAFYTLNYLRSIVRKIGMYEIAKRYHDDRFIIVDEGTLLSAHLLFVYASTSSSQEDIEKFASLVPLPELAVYVKAPVASLVQRSLQRGDAPKEMGSRNQVLIEEYVSQAVDMFDRLTAIRRIQERVLTVPNPDSAEGGREALADQVVARILNLADDCEQSATVPSGKIERNSEFEETYVSQNQ